MKKNITTAGVVLRSLRLFTVNAAENDKPQYLPTGRALTLFSYQFCFGTAPHDIYLE